jgi:hypothetical protein
MSTTKYPEQYWIFQNKISKLKEDFEALRVNKIHLNEMLIERFDAFIELADVDLRGVIDSYYLMTNGSNSLFITNGLQLKEAIDKSHCYNDNLRSLLGCFSVISQLQDMVVHYAQFIDEFNKSVKEAIKHQMQKESEGNQDQH